VPRVLPLLFAQVHWDVGAQAGATQRFSTGADRRAPAPSVGPSFAVEAHVALLPMVRAGAYFTQDTSPAPPASPRTSWAGGLHARVAPPLLGGAWRTWLAAGVGYAYVYSIEQHAAGGLIDLPVGVALGRKMGSPMSALVPFVELGARFGFGWQGPIYDHAAAASAGALYAGKEWFAMCASVGLSLEQ
jgi:hypothetical protein